METMETAQLCHILLQQLTWEPSSHTALLDEGARRDPGAPVQPHIPRAVCMWGGALLAPGKLGACTGHTVCVVMEDATNC